MLKKVHLDIQEANRNTVEEYKGLFHQITCCALLYSASVAHCCVVEPKPGGSISSPNMSVRQWITLEE